MRLFGPDGRFPLMRRGTHKRKIIEVSQTYRRELSHAEVNQRNAENLLQREVDHWFEVLDKLQGYYEGEVYVQGLGDPEDPNVGFAQVRIVPRDDVILFSFGVTRFLMNRLWIFDERDRRFIVGIIQNQVTKLLLESLVNESIGYEIR